MRIAEIRMEKNGFINGELDAKEGSNDAKASEARKKGKKSKSYDNDSGRSEKKWSRLRPSERN